MSYEIQGRVLVAGTATGPALVTREPLSFWGGYDSATGEIIDRAHPLAGEHAAGRILVLPFSRGSSTTTAVLLEAIRAGTAPAAIVVAGDDTFFALAAIVGDELYKRSLPVVAIAVDDLDLISTGDEMAIDVRGVVRGARRSVPGTS